MGTPETADAVRIIRTKSRSDRQHPTSEFSALLHIVRDAGLLHRRTGFYIAMFAVLAALFVGLAAGFVVLGDSWFQLLIAGGLGIVLTQFAFLAHEASHRQVFESGRSNDVAGRVIANLVVGISYSWWMTKHSRHHANPNVIGKDPDINRNVISFTPQDAGLARGMRAWLTRRQGYAFFPILVFEGLALHIHGFRTVFGSGTVDKRWLEIAMLTTRNLAYVAVVVLALSPGVAAAFIGVQLAVFGVYMGASFAPNHKGMPVLAKDQEVDFLRRQVLTSRNIRSSWLTNLYMGGLNYQVEHHLFPSMPRPHLRRAQAITKDYCRSKDIAYTETTLLESYAIVVRYLNRAGLSAGGDPFECPAATAFGR